MPTLLRDTACDHYGGQEGVTGRVFGCAADLAALAITALGAVWGQPYRIRRGVERALLDKACV